MIPCLFLKFTGIPCPGCGGQRSVFYLFQGNFKEAFLIYPAIYPLMIVGILILINLFFPLKNYSRWISTTSYLSIATVFIHYGIQLNQLYHFI